MQLQRQWIIGVMGGGRVTPDNLEKAHILGRLIAQRDWILLNGGRNRGIMQASAAGAREAGGLTVGILPDEDLNQMSEAIAIPIRTGMGQARNCINILSSDVVVACPGGTGTLSEIALALKSRRPVVTLDFDTGLVFDQYRQKGLLTAVQTPVEALKAVEHYLAGLDPTVE